MLSSAELYALTLTPVHVADSTRRYRTGILEQFLAGYPQAWITRSAIFPQRVEGGFERVSAEISTLNRS